MAQRDLHRDGPAVRPAEESGLRNFETIEQCDKRVGLFLGCEAKALWGRAISHNVQQ